MSGMFANVQPAVKKESRKVAIGTFVCVVLMWAVFGIGHLAAPEQIPFDYTVILAGGIGGVIANRAFLAGAAGGCQAEIGSASAMAAGGVAYLMGGDAEQISHAAALALKNLLGLACDPVAGLVEVPCVKRNVMGAVNAMTSSDMVMAGITSKIPPDEVIDAMRAIGRSMSEDIRETGKGGLAGTPTGVAIRERMAGTL